MTLWLIILGPSNTICCWIKGSHVYIWFEVIVVLLLWCQVILLWHQIPSKWCLCQSSIICYTLYNMSAYSCMHFETIFQCFDEVLEIIIWSVICACNQIQKISALSLFYVYIISKIDIWIFLTDQLFHGYDICQIYMMMKTSVLHRYMVISGTGFTIGRWWWHFQFQ